ncbi:MAG: hypothetical protein AB7G11_02580 [Phycisphaerales bacterium]
MLAEVLLAAIVGGVVTALGIFAVWPYLALLGRRRLRCRQEPCKLDAERLHTELRALARLIQNVEKRIVSLYDDLMAKADAIQAAIDAEAAEEDAHEALIADLNAQITALQAQLADKALTDEQRAAVVARYDDLVSKVQGIIDTPAPPAPPEPEPPAPEPVPEPEPTPNP